MAKCKNCKNLYYAEVIFKHGTSTIPCCFTDGEDIEDIDVENECVEFECMSNADKIRDMSDEELAEFLNNVNSAYAKPCIPGEDGHMCKWEDYPTHDKGCKDCFLEWLKSEAGYE